MDTAHSTADKTNPTFTINVKIGSSTFLIKQIKKTTAIQNVKKNLAPQAKNANLTSWELVHEGQRLTTTAWSCGIIVGDTDVTEGAVWRIGRNTPLNKFFAQCVSLYQSPSQLIPGKNDVLLYDELCVNVSLQDNSDEKSISLEENVSERSSTAVNLYATPRSNNIKLQTSEGKLYEGLNDALNNRVNFYKYTAFLDDEEIIPLNEHTVKSNVDFELQNREQKIKFVVQPPKANFFVKRPFNILDDTKTPYYLGFNTGDIIWVQSKRIMRALSKVQDFYIEPGTTLLAVKTIVVTIEEIGPKKRQLQLPIPEVQWQVRDLKFALFEHTCVVPSNIMLRKDDVEMQDEEMVSRYNVVENSVIHMELLHKPAFDAENPQSIFIHFNKPVNAEKSPIRSVQGSQQPILLDSEDEDENKKKRGNDKLSSAHSSASKNLKRKLDFSSAVDQGSQPAKKKVYFGSVESGSASEENESENDDNNITNIADKHYEEVSDDDDDKSGFANENYEEDSNNDNDENSEEEDSSNSEKSSSSLSAKWRASKNSAAKPRANGQRKKSNNNNNAKRPEPVKNKNNSKKSEPLANKNTNATQRARPKILPAIVTEEKQLPSDIEIKTIQGASFWENQIIYFVLLSTDDGLRSVWLTSELLSNINPKVLVAYLERKMQFRK